MDLPLVGYIIGGELTPIERLVDKGMPRQLEGEQLVANDGNGHVFLGNDQVLDRPGNGGIQFAFLDCRGVKHRSLVESRRTQAFDHRPSSRPQRLWRTKQTIERRDGKIAARGARDRKSTRLNSSYSQI